MWPFWKKERPKPEPWPRDEFRRRVKLLAHEAGQHTRLSRDELAAELESVATSLRVAAALDADLSGRPSFAVKQSEMRRLVF
jgi:hypothetical protein